MVFPDAETARLVRTCRQHDDLFGPAAAAAARRGHRLGAHSPVERDPRPAEEADGSDSAVQQLADRRGLPLGSTGETPIRFVRTGDNDTTYQIVAELMGDGFYVNTAVFPAVSAATAACASR